MDDFEAELKAAQEQVNKKLINKNQDEMFDNLDNNFNEGINDEGSNIGNLANPNPILAGMVELPKKKKKKKKNKPASDYPAMSAFPEIAHPNNGYDNEYYADPNGKFQQGKLSFFNKIILIFRIRPRRSQARWNNRDSRLQYGQL